MKVAIIIPCYNEADRLDANKFTEYLLQNTHVHFYFIDDGSTDNTISIPLVHPKMVSSHFKAETFIEVQQFNRPLIFRFFQKLERSFTR